MSDDGASPLLADIFDGEWLSRQDFPPLRYAVPGIVPEGLTGRRNRDCRRGGPAACRCRCG